VSVTLRRAHGRFAAGDRVAIWEMPNRGGGYCWRISRAAAEMGAGGCARDPQQVDHGRLPSEYGDGIASGWAPAASGIDRVTVNGVDAALANGAFIAETGAGPVTIVGYDAAGQEVASTHLPGR
jgi:hypothetical protein